MKQFNQTEAFSGAAIAAQSDDGKIQYNGTFKKDEHGKLKECSVVISGENVAGNANFSQGNISVNLYNGDVDAFKTASNDFQGIISRLAQA